MRKKANRTGTRSRGQIIPKGDNCFLVRFYVGRTNKGRRRYCSTTIHGSRRDAERERTKRLREVDTASFVVPSDIDLGTYLQQWLDGPAKVQVAARTLEDYGSRLKRDVVPLLGHLRLDRVQKSHVQSIVTSMMDRKLSPTTVRYTHAVLRQALRQAVRDNVLIRNPSDDVTLPRKIQREMSVLDSTQVNRFLVMTGEDPLHAAWSVLLLAGLRPGELLALQWPDLAGEQLTVQRALKKVAKDCYALGAPKTARSRRTVVLPEQTIRALQHHRRTQAEQIMAAGPAYLRNDLMFANSVGQPMDLSKLRKRFKDALKGTGLPDVRLYDTRHTHATMMLKNGENPKIVSERLGHTDIGITLDIYSHVLPGMQEAAVRRLESLLATGT